ncbi:MAG: hypothetical protein WC169_02040 [Dehalococcoidia bacterium]|jgi:hypothetical protein
MKTNINSITKLPCQHNCQAPLCPLDCHDNAVWYPDDDICHSKAITKPAWVGAQRKIQRLYQKGLVDDSECFTRPMLEGIKRIGKGLHGMKPEKLHRDSTG